MRIAVVGAGAAGLTAAHRLQQAGYAVEVLEALDVVGGRTRTAHFGPDHYCDNGAGWLASFYTRTLALFDELGGRELLLRPREGRGADGLLVHGRVHRIPFALQAIATSALLTADEKERMAAYVARLRTEQPGELRVDLAVPFLIGAAAAGAIVGDNLGNLAGREGGYRLLRRYGPFVRLLCASPTADSPWASISFGLSRRLSGAHQRPWSRFLAFNAAGFIVLRHAERRLEDEAQRAGIAPLRAHPQATGTAPHTVSETTEDRPVVTAVDERTRVCTT
jgi:phytoene dehydrogenase-like protein